MRDLHTVHSQKLHNFLQQDVSGYSFEEIVIHYGFIGHSAAQTSIAGYIQTGTFENAENYFYLAAKANEISDKLWIANPHKQPQQGQEIQFDRLMAAVLSGCTSSAIDMLEKARMTFEEEPKQPGKSRKDCQQSEKRKKRISLEIDFYESLLRNDDEKAHQLLPELDEFHPDTPMLHAMHAFFEQDSEQFTQALIQHMKEFRNTPYPEELNCFVLVIEALYLKRKNFDPLDLADAPALLLKLPECNPALVEERIGLHLPSFDVGELLKMIDKEKIGPKFKQY